jgi:hypothetical protein
MVAEWTLADDTGFGLMPGLMFDKTTNGERFTSALLGAVVGKRWTDQFRTFAEIAASQIARQKYGGSVVTLNLGGPYLLTPLVQLDSAVSYGLDRNTPDFGVTFGISAKY